MAKRKSNPPKDTGANTEIISNNTLKAQQLPPVIVATKQEIKVLGGLVAGKTPRAALKKAGLEVTKEVADVYCGGLQRRYNQAMQDALLRRGVTVDKLVDVIAKQLDADKVVVVAGALADVPDNKARQGAVNIALDLLPGARAPKKVEHEVRSLESIIMKLEISHDE